MAATHVGTERRNTPRDSVQVISSYVVPLVKLIHKKAQHVATSEFSNGVRYWAAATVQANTRLKRLLDLFSDLRNARRR